MRLLIGDTDSTDATRQVYADAEVDRFLLLASGVFGAAAIALRAIAANEVQVLKVVDSLDLKTDGAKAADALRALADSYDARAAKDAEDAEDAAIEAGFEIAEIAETPEQYGELLRKQARRSAV